MVDVHKACKVLIQHELMSSENDLLANKTTYHECYLKMVPTCISSSVDFTLKLAKFGILNIEHYFQSMKTSALLLFHTQISCKTPHFYSTSFLIRQTDD